MMRKKIPKIGLFMIFMIITILGLAQTTVIVRPLPVVNAGPDKIIPSGQTSVQPDITSDDPGPGVTYNYTWTMISGSFTSTVMKPNLTAGTYNVLAINSFTCSASDQVVISASISTGVWTQKPLPPLCRGDSVSLDLYLPIPYSGVVSGANVSNRMFFGNTPGTFTVTWTSTDGSVVDQTTITVVDGPNIMFVEDSLPNCEGRTMALPYTGTADSYQWSYLYDPNTVLSTQQNYSVVVGDTLTRYLLTTSIVNSGKTCSSKDTVIVVPINADFRIIQSVTPGPYGSYLSNEVQLEPNFKKGLSYNWYSGDWNSTNNTSTLVSPTFVYERFGTFTITLTMTSSLCGVSKEVKKDVTVNHISTGIGDNELTSLSVFPNPATDNITIKGIEKATQIIIFDMIGRVMFIQNLEGQDSQDVNVSSYTPGIYNIKIVAKSGNQKVIKLSKR